jgi:hypothetical protein
MEKNITAVEFKLIIDAFIMWFNKVYSLLSSVTIGGVSLFGWLLGLSAVTVVATIFHSIGGVGSVGLMDVLQGTADKHAKENRRKSKK